MLINAGARIEPTVHTYIPLYTKKLPAWVDHLLDREVLRLIPVSCLGAIWSGYGNSGTKAPLDMRRAIEIQGRHPFNLLDAYLSTGLSRHGQGAFLAQNTGQHLSMRR